MNANCRPSLPALTFLLCTIGLGLCRLPAFAQGPLVPPGPPAAMMKTLDQVEPRTPISSLPFAISQPGSYYLTTNLTGIPGQHGITITASRATLDLMGFELRGVAGSLSGILMNPAVSPHVRNGSIVGWGQDGINGTNGGGGIIEDLRISNNGRYGVSFNSSSQIRRCIVFANGNVGVYLSNDVEVDDCVVSGNASHGIQAGTGSTIRRCLTVGNVGTGITGSGINGLNIIECNSANNGNGIWTLGQTIVKDSFARSNSLTGISVGPGSAIQGCNASDNGTNGISVDLGSTVQACLAANNRGHGIAARNAATIIGCTARINSFANIQVDGDCIVRDCACDNATGVSGVGIHALTGDNRIENNNLTDNRTGLKVDSAGNYVANNTVRNNSTNYVIATGSQLNLLLSQLPQYVPWPATIKLAGTLTGVRNTNGITVASDNVTIDLNDHALVGVDQALDGIRVEGTRTNITVRNGSVLGWPGDGVDAANAVNSQLRNINAARNLGAGLRAGEGSLISACSARTNTSDGIVAGSGCRIVDCSTSKNGSEGIVTGSGCSVEGCTAFDNTANGIYGGLATRISGCTAYSNGTNGIALLNTPVIVTTPNGGLVQNCVSRGNSGNGIQVGSRVEVLNNNCAENTAAGLSVLGSGCRIDSNHATAGQRCFHVPGTDNLIIRNSAQGATVANYDIAAGNHDAARITSPGSSFASTSPWANFSY